MKRYCIVLYFLNLPFIASQLQIHPFCLLCENRYGPFKYFSFNSWHNIKLYQSGHRRDTAGGEKPFFLPGSSVLTWQHAQLLQHPVPASQEVLPASGSCSACGFSMPSSCCVQQLPLALTPTPTWVVWQQSAPSETSPP